MMIGFCRVRHLLEATASRAQSGLFGGARRAALGFRASGLGFIGFRV